LIKRDRPGRVKLAVWGACTPTLCRWGTVTARLFASDVGGRAGTGLRANYDLDFALVTITAHLVGGTQPSLRIEEYTRFIDGSARSDYWSSAVMRRG
jgi:hypothetical protein